MYSRLVHPVDVVDSYLINVAADIAALPQTQCAGTVNKLQVYL
jgi:hypothetical protein